MKTWPQKIVLVRHGESEGNIQPIQDLFAEGKANHTFPLTKRGREQAVVTGDYLQKVHGEFDAYFCSTFVRTRQTLALLYPLAKPQIDSRLNEMLRGVWHTLPRERVEQLYPEEIQRREYEGEFHYRPFGGQSCQDVEVLIYSFINDLRTYFAGKTILISGHGTWMLLFWRIMLNREAAEFEERYQTGTNKYKNCAVCIYEENASGQIALSEDNVTCW